LNFDKGISRIDFTFHENALPLLPTSWNICNASTEKLLSMSAGYKFF